MITILIPVLKLGYLESQLHWLDTQTYKDFTVIAMDAFHHSNKHQPWAKHTRSYPFIHVPLIHNIDFPKRFDYSVKNNLALLAPTDTFLFLSDTHYPTKDFMATVAENLMKDSTQVVFESPTVLSTAYDQFRHTVDLEGRTNHTVSPVFVFDRKTFFYVLNGFDEALTYAAPYESMPVRMCNIGHKFLTRSDVLFHIHHTPDSNQFGRRWKKPCEKCDMMFARWKFDRAYDIGTFPMENFQDIEAAEQLIHRDPELGIQVFECPNCGFGGMLNPAEYEKMLQRRVMTGAPDTAFDGRVGRNLGKIYETMTRQVGNNIDAKLSYLITTY